MNIGSVAEEDLRVCFDVTYNNNDDDDDDLYQCD
jgi:hypothetical protein